jgi:glyoxylase-like metal-dependent hydrolase (beta-lactamase superfamily II)
MRVTRRTFMRSGGAAIAAAGGLVPVWAQASVTVGGYQIDTLSDGNLVLPGSMVIGDLPAEEATAILARYNLGTEQFTPDCNVTLLRDGENTVLFDVGAGANFQSSAGRLGEALEALGVAPEEVTHVVFTHGHPDHLWGVLDDFDEPIFYNARHMIGVTERDYWLDPETVNTIRPDRQAFAAGALRYLTAIEGQLETFDNGDEILPGIVGLLQPGHTPGHMVFDIAQADQQLMILGRRARIRTSRPAPPRVRRF